MGDDYKDKVVAFIETRGPVVPAQLGRHMGSDSMIAGAMLSDMVSKGQLKMSNLKVGGSHLYYLPGQEPEVLKFLDHLDPKDRQVVALLEQKKVLRESDLTPLQRVSLRSVSDFALPLEVSFHGQKESFWKWFLLPDDETEHTIRGMIMPEQKKESPVETPAVVEKKVPDESPMESDDSSAQEDEQVSLPVSFDESKITGNTDPWLQTVRAFFEANNISVVSENMVKKKTEYDFVIKVPSVFGNLMFYCKAKSKARLSDSDISAAYVQGQLRKLPALMLGNGDLSKKALSLMTSELSLTYKKVVL